MTPPFLEASRTVRRLQQLVERNLSRRHGQTRHESTSTSGSAVSSSSTTTTTTTSPSAKLQTRTIPGPAWAWIDPLLTPFRAYGRMQARSPLMTQFESTLVIYYLGDLSAQTMQTSGFADAQYEPLRGLRAMLIGAGSSIPGYRWFLFLGRHFNYSSHLLSLAVKVVVNQCCFTPVFNCYFFGMQTLLAGGSLQDAKERIIRAVPVTWVNSWKLWPAVTAFSFTFVPWQFRNVFAGVIAIGWQTYLSWLNRLEEQRLAVDRTSTVLARTDGDEVGQRERPPPKKRKKKEKKKQKKQKDEDENEGNVKR